MPGHTLSDLLHSWKPFTSSQANKFLQRRGEAFWQAESFDHWIRDDEERAVGGVSSFWPETPNLGSGVKR
jgi:hypothetical protein